MDVGLNLPVMAPGLDRDRLLEWCRRIDAGPFSTLAAGERITFPNPEMAVTLSAAAALTERVRIMPNVLVLPLHAAPLVAKQLATLDVLSGGRLCVGVGAGARREDYAAAGRDFDAPRLRQLEEAVTLLRRAWAGEIVVEGAERPVEPLPVQPGGPEILAGSLSERSIRRAAVWADGLTGFSFGPSLPEVERAFALARREWDRAGRSRPPRLVTNCWFALGPDARRRMDEYLGLYLGFMGAGVAERLAPSVTTTSATALRDVVRAIADLGADELLLVPTSIDPDEVRRVADALA